MLSYVKLVSALYLKMLTIKQFVVFISTVTNKCYSSRNKTDRLLVLAFSAAGYRYPKYLSNRFYGYTITCFYKYFF